MKWCQIDILRVGFVVRESRAIQTHVTVGRFRGKGYGSCWDDKDPIQRCHRDMEQDLRSNCDRDGVRPEAVD